MAFLPINRKEMAERGWESCDFVYVIGDAYVDHPSFGHAIISRVLEANGYSVGIISQPDWKNPKSIDVFGRPRLRRQQAPPENRCLHPRGRHGQAARLRHHCVL